MANHPSDTSKKFELWSSDGEGSTTFIESTNESVLKQLPNDARLIWEVNATDWVEAHKLLHQHMGWEPYVPPPDADELGLSR